MKRVIIIVLDSLGVGALPDAAQYTDTGADTFGHIAQQMMGEEGRFSIPNLLRLGFGNIQGVAGGEFAQESPAGAFGRLMEKSTGKDTITGHWELAGLYTKIPFKTYPDGFPSTFIEDFENRIGRKILGNYAASGTEIIEELGSEHEETGYPIVYTSADSVFQIAVNTQVISLEELYRICEIAREMLVGDVACGRVIARPYVMEDGKRVRTSDRKDYAVSPSGRALPELISSSGKPVCAIGKISDIFNGQGITESIHTEDNMDGVNKTIEAIVHGQKQGLIFTNLVDFDSKFGHRRNPIGYGKAIEAFDLRLPEILEAMNSDDVLILCADHGNDPIAHGWDHTREYVPVIVYGEQIKEGFDLGTGESFADIGATVAEILGTEKTEIGISFLNRIKK